MLVSMSSAPRPNPPPRQPNPKTWMERLRVLASRMRHDLQLAIITLYSLCALIIVGPFAIFRLANGDTAIGVADSLILTCFLAFAVLAWHPAWTRRVANLLAAIAAIGVMGVTVFLDLSPMWAISTLVGNFLMAERRVALIANGIMITAIGLHPEIFQDAAEHATFIAVVAMTSLFSLIFASRVATQRIQLSELAARDGLTGAYNRRSLDRDLAQLVRTPSPKPHSLALIDLDDFKRLNDEHGHQYGDGILMLLARVAGDGTRERDRFYRYGGEEFVLLLPETTLAGAEVALINLKRKFNKAQLNADPAVTFSAGLAHHAPGEDPAAWLARADRALMQAKRDGKDCYRQSSTSLTTE